ncbi:kinesin family member C2/C3, partial [Strigomonas culicis]
MDPLKTEINGILSAQIAHPKPEGEHDATMRLVEHIRKGNALVVLECVKDHFKYNPPAVQIKMMHVLDQCLNNSGPQFAVMLSTEKWADRFFKVAKTTTDAAVRDCIMYIAIGWAKRYHTSGYNRLLQRFAESKTLATPFRQLLRRFEDKHRSSAASQQKQRAELQNFDNVQNVNPNQILDNEETFLLQCQGDLASLEYSLEHPHILQDDDIAKDCKKHKLDCMHMLESEQHERIAGELMTIIERYSDVLELYEAMTGVDMGEGSAAKTRALNDDDLNEADSDDDEHQKRLRARGRHQDPNEVLLQAQQQQQQFMDNERNETNQLRQQLEELRTKHEDLQNKYKDAKLKNKEAVAALEQYADRVDALERDGAGKAGALATLAASAAAVAEKKPQVSEEMVQRMRSSTQSIRQGLRQIREMYAKDIGKDAQYYATQLTSAMAAIVQAGKMERQSDQKALQWTQELYKKELKLRKQYYNTIQELKGNIRVYCRVRPMLKMELDGGHKDIMTYPSTDELKFIDANGRPKLFEFDEVYPPDAPQSKVFEDTSPLIDSVVDGFNVCIFAYGQTGSGKTFTMNGGTDEISKGINTRALERLFSIIEERNTTEKSTVAVSVLEIYIEEIRDLLVSKQVSATTSYEVKQGGPYGTYVTNLTEVEVHSPKDIYAIMGKAMQNRSEGQTNMNEHSSRSHMLLYITVRTTNLQTNIQTYGKLSLVDLAGSERLEKSGAEGQQLKEAVSINKSLSALGDVISSLSQNTKHVPFRNSTLTFLLQDSMAGQAKVLMFVCVSPASYNANESGSSLL